MSCKMRGDTPQTTRVSHSDGRSGVTKHLLKTCILTLALMAFSAAPALAYQESTSSVNPSSTPIFACPTCHGLESGATSPTVAARTGLAGEPESGTPVGSLKGPHGGYSSGTQKCQTCHTIHGADNNLALLPGATISATCYTCHDGTGGGGVYGVIKQRTGFDPTQVVAGKTIGGVHRIGYLNGNSKVDVPGGASDGSSLETTFTGENGALTCTDCHSPHNANTVAPFLGDRKRSSADTTTATLKTNRLLKTRPTSAATATAQYGSNWCEACHKGRHSQASTMGNHPAADSTTAPGWNYNKVSKRSGYGASALTSGSLGGDNFGYVMPEPRGAQPYPICQQCHEDGRNVGDATQFQITSATESFTVSVDGTTAANPRFQNFPHETVNDSFLIESYDDLCLNCHVAP